MSTTRREDRQIPTPFAGPRSHIAVLDIHADKRELPVARRDVSDGNWDALLWGMPITGGSARRLGELRGQDAAWSSDGNRIVYARNGELHLAGGDGTELRTVANVSGTIYRPRWSPDQTRLRFSKSEDAISEGLAIWQVKVDGSNLSKLFPAWTASHGGGTWTADGRYFVFEPAHDIWGVSERSRIFSAAGGAPVQLTFGPTRYSPPIPSVDGRQLLLVMPRGELLRYDLQSHSFVPYLRGLSVEGLDFSPRGDPLCHTTYPEGELWLSNADGSRHLQLSSAPMHAYLPRWSPDGEQIEVAGKVPGKPWKVYLVPSRGGRIHQLTSHDRPEFDPNWAPDGKSIILAPLPLGTEREKAQLYVFDFRTNQKSAMPGSEQLFSPRWSPQGNFIAALSVKEGHLMLLDLKTSKWLRVAGGPAEFSYVVSRRQIHSFSDLLPKRERCILHAGPSCSRDP